MNSETVTIDGSDYEVFEWNRTASPGSPEYIDMLIGGGPTLTPRTPPFPFQGSLWYLTGLTISSLVGGTMQMRLQATNKTIPAPPPSAPLPPKSRLRLPSLPLSPARVNDHADCVPLDHYNDLKTFIAMELNDGHGGMLMVPHEILNAWSDWRVLHSKDQHGMHTFIAVDPSVVISEEVDEEEDIPF